MYRNLESLDRDKNFVSPARTVDTYYIRPCNSESSRNLSTHRFRLQYETFPDWSRNLISRAILSVLYYWNLLKHVMQLSFKIILRLSHFQFTVSIFTKAHCQIFPNSQLDYNLKPFLSYCLLFTPYKNTCLDIVIVPN